MFEFMNMVKDIRNKSKMSRDEMVQLSEIFYEDMREKKVLKMLPSHVFASGMMKNGEYLALDFGGSNVRVKLYNISENGEFEVVNSVTIKLKGESFNFTTEEYELKDVFRFVVAKMRDILENEKEYILGHTFAFPVDIIGQNQAKIVAMSKGFSLRNAIGEDVNKILMEELKKAELNVVPVSIINDTTASLLAGKFANRDTDIACVIGTGHNIAFVDNDGQIINTECGLFNIGIPINSYDDSFLKMIPNERAALMEAFVGGRNSPKIAINYRNILQKEFGKIFTLSNIEAETLSMALEEQYDPEYNLESKIFLSNISRIIYDRVAQLVVSEIMGILKRIDPNIEKNHNIVFNGSVYEKTPYLRRCITKYIKLMYGEKADKITHSLVKDGSSIGAAISAAILS